MAAGVSMTLSDLSRGPGGACSIDGDGGGGGVAAEMGTAAPRVPTAKYTKMGETLRHVIPSHMQCSMACGGRACKYENPSRWTDEEQAIKGLYSSWITDTLLAMARPSTEIIEKYNIIDQFKRYGLKTIINLQRPGEHASCGNPLEQESGFTYRPETLMEAGVYYYNFGWKDYGVASLTTILDMVKVMSFAAQEGKMAVHCHAGLGRTGVLLACYLVFTSRMNADQAILFVRAKRPNSIQTRGQLLCVREFAQFLVPLRSVFSCVEPKASAVTLAQYLTRQRHLLHGYEARQMKNVPKIVQLVCRLLVDIAHDREATLPDGRREAADLAAEVEKTVSELALRQLGKEMRGKGIPRCRQDGVTRDQPLVSDNELDPLWRRQHAIGPSAFSFVDSKRLCCSDSLLHKLGCPQPEHLDAVKSDQGRKRSSSHGSGLATWDLPTQEIFCSPKMATHASSVDGEDGPSHPRLISPTLLPTSDPSAREHERSVVTGTGTVALVSARPELPRESRCLLVAKALAMEGSGHQLSSKISAWQTELNCGEEAWELLCLERDPEVLAGLMWSWLEQLKDPIISADDITALREKNVNPHNALLCLQKCQRLTLLCVLHCAAHLLLLPVDMETRLLEQTIKAFTWVPLTSDSETLYQTLKGLLALVLKDLRSGNVPLENNDS